MEALDHAEGAVDLSRLNDLGVVLFNHDTDKPIGRVERAWTEGGRGEAFIVMDSDEFSETIYQKMVSGSLRGVSVSYVVDKREEVAEGKRSTDGRFAGPVSVGRHWAPYEISIVTIPADVNVGVGRSAEDEEEQPGELEAFAQTATYERRLKYNQNLIALRRP